MKKMKSVSEVVDLFIKFESENKLFDDTIAGVKYWHLVRFFLYKKILESNFEIGANHKNLEDESILFRIGLKYKQLKNFVIKNPLIKSKRGDILIFNHNRKVMNNGYYDCIYTDILGEHLDHSTIVIEEPFFDTHYNPVRNKEIQFTDYINFMVGIKRRILSKSMFTKNDYVELNEIVKLLNSNFGTNFDQDKTSNSLINIIARYKLLYPYLKKIILKVKPKIILEVVSYNTSRFVVNDIAKKLQIPTIELQHGVMGRYHLAYNFINKSDIDTFPDYLFLYGEYWKENTRFPIDNSQLLVVGWPYYEKKISANKMKTTNSNITILFISQGLIGKELSKLAVEFDRTYNQKSYRIIYKLHPGEYDRWRKEYPWLQNNENIQVIDNNDNDMHFYFSKADIQVGVSSTAIFEGIGYNLETLIYKTHSYEYMEELLSSKYAKLIESSSDMIHFVNDYNKDCKEVDVNYFWAENSLAKVVSEIEKIITKNRYSKG